jgi:hypothetical protein
LRSASKIADLGDDARGTGYEVVCEVEKAVVLNGLLTHVMRVHSANTAAAERMNEWFHDWVVCQIIKTVIQSCRPHRSGEEFDNVRRSRIEVTMMVAVGISTGKFAFALFNVHYSTARTLRVAVTDMAYEAQVMTTSSRNFECKLMYDQSI